MSTFAIHNLIDYKLNSRQLVEYKLVTKNVLNLLKNPLYIQQANELFGKSAALITHEILVNGYIEMSSVILKVVARLANETNERDSKKIDAIYNETRECFAKLVGNEYLERLPPLESVSNFICDNDEQMETDKKTTTPTTSKPKKLEKIPKFTKSDQNVFTLPVIRIDGKPLLFLQDNN